MESRANRWAFGALVLQIISAIGSLAFLILTARGLSLSDRGLFAMFAVICLVGQQVASLGLPSSVLHFSGRGHSATSMIGTLTGTLVLTSGLVAAATWALWRIMNPETIALWRVGSFLWIAIPLLTFGGVVQWARLGRGHFVQVALFRGLGVLLSATVVGFFVANRSLDLEKTISAWILGWFAMYLGLLITGEPNIGSLSPPRRTLITFGLKSLPAGVGGYLTSRLDQWLVGVFSGAQAAGIYSVSLGGSELALFIPQAFGSAMFVSQSQAEEKPGLRSISRMIWAGIGVVVIGAALGPALIPLVFGSNYASSIIPFEILLFGSIPLGLQRLLGGILAGRGAPEVQSVAAMVSAVLLIAVGIPLIIMYGPIGGALACLASYSVGALITVDRYRRFVQP